MCNNEDKFLIFQITTNTIGIIWSKNLKYSSVGKWFDDPLVWQSNTSTSELLTNWAIKTIRRYFRIVLLFDAGHCLVPSWNLKKEIFCHVFMPAPERLFLYFIFNIFRRTNRNLYLNIGEVTLVYYCLIEFIWVTNYSSNYSMNGMYVSFQNE